jgi:hypothetical protein
LVRIGDANVRALLAIAGFAAWLAGFAAGAEATELPVHRVGYGGFTYNAIGRHAGQVWILDDQPGVVVRAYWLAPWQGRHYYPVTGKRPRVGRLERISATRHYKPAESYYRYWSTSSAVLPALPPGLMPAADGAAAPYVEPSLK